MGGLDTSVVLSSRKSKARMGFVVACFFFSTLFFYGEIGRNIALILNLVSPFFLLVLSSSSRTGSAFRSVGNLAFTTLFFIVISFIIVGGGWGSLLSNIGIVLLICTFYNTTITKAECSRFVRLLYILHIFLILYTLYFRFNADGYIGTFNPNSIALQALINLVFFILFPHKVRLIQSALVVSSIALVVYSNSRTCMGACVLLALIWLFRRIVQKKPGILKLSFGFVLILSIAIPYIYSLLLGDNVAIDDINALSAEKFDKGLFTGRELIWAYAWKQLLRTPINFLFGIGSHFEYDDRDGVGANFHSSFFTVDICCGFIGLLVISILLYKIVIKDYKLFARYKPQVIYEKMLYIPIMFTGIFESTLLVGNFAIMLYFLLCTINTQAKEITNNT